MKTLFGSLIIIYFSTFSFSQAKIIGSIQDKSGQPLSFASVSLLMLQDSTMVISNITDENGEFVFDGIEPGKYFVLSAYIGYEDLYSNSFEIKSENRSVNVDLKMNETSVMLKEAVIVAKKPFLEQKPDRLVVNVAGSPVAAGKTAQEILKKVPGVVIVQGKVTLGGSTGVQIWLNGKPSPYQDMNALLRDMPGDQIEKIELITQPGAQYDAAGGPILNVILRRDANLGFKGTASFTTTYYKYDQRFLGSNDDNEYGRLNPNLNLTYRNGKLNTFANATYNKGSYFDGFDVQRFIAGQVYDGKNLSINDYTYQALRLGADYDFTQKTNVGIAANFSGREGSDKGINVTEVFDISNPNEKLNSFATDINTKGKNAGTYASVSFKHHFDKKKDRTLTIDTDYNKFTSKDVTSLTIYPLTMPESRSLSRQTVDQPVDLYVFKSDYTHGIDSSFKLTSGLKSSFATIDNGLLFERGGIVSPNESNRFLYNENINAAYINVNKTINKVELSGGLRVEQTVVSGKIEGVKVLDRNYTKFFPSISALYRLNDHLGIQSSYAKRFNRPRFDQQNPFTYFIDSLTYTTGNPSLQPEIFHTTKLTLTYDNQPVFGISYNKTFDVIIQNAPKLEGTKTFTTVENLAEYTNVEIQLNFPIKIGKYIDGFGGNQAIYHAYDATYNNTKYKVSRWNWLAYWGITATLPKDFKFEVSGFYLTKFLNEFFTIDPIWGLDLGLSKSLMDGNATITIGYDDIFNTQNTTARTDFNDIKVDFTQYQFNRKLSLTLRYNFGNTKVKNIQRTNASESESSRIKVN
jgi:hypothetical protein